LVPIYVYARKNAPQPLWYSNLDTEAEVMMKKIGNWKIDTTRRRSDPKRYYAALIRLNYLQRMAGLVRFNRGALDEFYDQLDDQDRSAILLDGGVPLQMNHYTTGFREFIGDPTVRPPHTLESAWAIRCVLIYCYSLV
jgi:hypothetical protein